MHITQNAAIADSADLALNTAEQTTWTIVGSGAIGLLAASNAALKGSPKVQLALRPQNNVGTSFAFSFCAGQQEYPILLSSITKTTPIQALLLPVKAYAVADALKTYLPNLTNNAQIVLCHNGMGTIEQVLPLLSAEQGLWFASTTHGAYKSTPLRRARTRQNHPVAL
ncbi:MAG: 2-dehydropantoate 2-reductase [Rheinheimera sp.]|nr:2-dehydropantoate 2-reductase [Rheinheimera sp.]